MAEKRDTNDGLEVEPVAARLDEGRQASATEYARIRRWLLLAELGLSLVYVVLWLATGLSVWWRERLSLVTETRWLLVPLFAAGFGGLFSALTAPLSFFSGFVLPHRYGLSHQSFRFWLWDQVKGLSLSSLLGLLVLELIYWLLAAAPGTWWLWVALVMLVLSVVLSSLAPVVFLPLFYKLTPLQNENLVDRLTRLAERAGTRVGGVYTFDESRKTSTANAALVGLGRTRRIILADTLLAAFSEDEIETVMAHELGHHLHHDLGFGILVQSVLNLAGFWVAGWVMAFGVGRMGLEGMADPAGMPLLFLALSLYGLVTMPAGNVWSRWRERLADRYALRTTGKAGAFVSAMTRLANQNLAEVQPPGWVEFLLHSHPSISRRVEMAWAYSGSAPTAVAK